MGRGFEVGVGAEGRMVLGEGGFIDVADDGGGWFVEGWRGRDSGYTDCVESGGISGGVF